MNKRIISKVYLALNSGRSLVRHDEVLSLSCRCWVDCRNQSYDQLISTYYRWDSQALGWGLSGNLPHSLHSLIELGQLGVPLRSLSLGWRNYRCDFGVHLRIRHDLRWIKLKLQATSFSVLRKRST